MTELVAEGRSQIVDSEVQTLELRTTQDLTKISVILPIYNEAAILPANVGKLKTTLDALGEDYEILLCDDNSRDGTETAAESLVSVDTNYFRFPKRIGKGGTIKNAARLSNGNIMIFIDADIPVSPSEIARAVRLMREGQKLVVGVRRTRPFTTLRRKLLSKGFNAMMNLFFRTGIEDHQCGFKAIDRHTADTLFPKIRSDHFMFDAELIVYARSLGIPIHTLQVDWVERREDSDSKISSLRVLLTMMIDLALLRLSLFGRKDLVSLRQVDIGSLRDANGKSSTVRITVMKTNHPRFHAVFRKLYLFIAYYP